MWLSWPITVAGFERGSNYLNCASSISGIKRRRQPHGFFDNKFRTPLGFVVNAPDVSAEHAHAHHLQTAHHENQNHDRGNAALELPAGQFHHDDDDDAHDRERGDAKADHDHQAQQIIGKRDDAVETDAQAAGDAVVFSLARVARFAVEWKQMRFESDHGDQPAQEAVAFVEFHELVDHAPVEQTEVASVARNLDIRDFVDEPVPAVRDQFLERMFAGARTPLRDHDLETVAPAFHHLRNQLRRVLHVAVNHHDDLPARIREAGHRRRRLAEAPRKRQHFDARIFGVGFADDLERAAGAGIGREDDFEILADLLEHAGHSRQEFGQDLFFVVNGHDHRNEGQDFAIFHDAFRGVKSRRTTSN